LDYDFRYSISRALDFEIITDHFGVLSNESCTILYLSRIDDMFIWIYELQKKKKNIIPVAE